MVVVVVPRMNMAVQEITELPVGRGVVVQDPLVAMLMGMVVLVILHLQAPHKDMLVEMHTCLLVIGAAAVEVVQVLLVEINTPRASVTPEVLVVLEQQIITRLDQILPTLEAAVVAEPMVGQEELVEGVQAAVMERHILSVEMVQMG